ncbi:hypothetical protein FHS85_000072 [Rhodoligotrophos appendicifer]|uniref:TIGR03862 family flavoprotein n=1 Tax=Rhodoligotrophos appendicifer TaxID=987056 RepID=UPI00117FF084|nr:TIGR03862 family flavoprotein [Rhodoligotrophos appendicifer]
MDIDVAIIGGGPAGLMAADVLSKEGLSVTVFERMPSVGRKLLMAGRGGLNLTHSEDIGRFLSRFPEMPPLLGDALQAFPPDALRAWADALGQDTFVGSSGRVFPRAMKASPLLRQWLRDLDRQGVQFRLRHRWAGWTPDGALSFHGPADALLHVRPAVTLLALGGASWPRLGSDGGWVDLLEPKDVLISPLRPANCGFTVAWTSRFRDRFAGQPLKRIALSFGDQRMVGEAMVTGYGIEGGAVYALSAGLREMLHRNGTAELIIDLRPDLSLEQLTERLGKSRKGESQSNILRKAARLSPLAINLLREVHGQLPRDPQELAAAIKRAPLKLSGVQSIDRAISTAGGVAFTELDSTFMLKRLPGVFVAGEMLDWEAPTGGYLLQATFATGRRAAEGALQWLRHIRA